jgi:hypothetical protein
MLPMVLVQHVRRRSLTMMRHLSPVYPTGVGVGAGGLASLAKRMGALSSTRRADMMPTASAAFFGELDQRGYEPALQTLSGTVRFDIIGEGSWRVTVNRGTITVAKSEAPAECTFVVAADDFVTIVRNEMRPFAAALQGRVQFTGDPALALVTMHLFPCLLAGAQ